MKSIFTKNFGVLNAKNFEKLVTASFANTYVSIGRNKPWANNDIVPNPKDNSNTFYDVWNNMIGMKRITSADMNLVIPRIDWVANTTYTEYTQDTEIFAQAQENDIAYTNKFYVRNIRDQVFKCLFNNNGSASTIMPEITLGGQLPENPFIETGDAYKWKYMYTIPAGLKQKFFTSQFMPVISESNITSAAVEGRLDIIKIIDAGKGYNGNANGTSLNILTVTGDGTGANLTARVTTSANANASYISGINILNGGKDYTRAIITVNNGPPKIGTTNYANVVAVISPPGGHGSDVARELGASSIMLTVVFEGDENGVLPVEVLDVGGFRQIAIIKDPKLANSAYATGPIYRTTTKYSLSQPNRNFQHKETVFEGTSLSTASFTGVVEHFDSGANILYLNNLIGTVNSPATITGVTSGAIATVLSVTAPDLKLYSGDLLYIENREEIVRSLVEAQQLKLTLRF